MIGVMRRFRRALQIGLLVIIAAFVASLFVFGSRGVGGNGEDRDWVARVNGETIPVERYQRRYQAYYDTYAQMYRDRFTPELAERIGLQQQVVSDLVQEALVVQRARAEGLEVSDEELNVRIHMVPAFQEGGVFSMKRYQEFLKRRGFSASGFEGEVRRELTREKVEGLVKNAVTVTDAEVERTYALRHEAVRAAWGFVELQPLLTATTVRDEDLQKYLKEHEDVFRQPERRRVQYVLLNPKDFIKPVTDAEVQAYYRDHASEFAEPRSFRLAHVLARVPETGGSQADDRAKAKIAEAIRRAKAGEDFAAIAKQLSEDEATASAGGDIGQVPASQLLPEIADAAGKLKPGEVTAEPLRTRLGYQAIKLLEVRPGGTKPLAEVAPKIREGLAAEAAERAARARAEEAKTALQAAPDFMAEAKKLGLSPVDTRVQNIERPPGMPRGETLEESAFGLAVGGIAGPVKTPVGFAVLKVIEALPAAVPPFAEIREQVAAAAKREKAEAAALERAKQLVADARSGDFAAAAKKAGAQTGETQPFSRVKTADKLPGDVMLAALQTVAGGVTEPVKTPQGVYVLKVLARTPADLGDLDKERDKVRTELLSSKQNQTWVSWLSTARAKAKVEMSPQLARPVRRG